MPKVGCSRIGATTALAFSIAGSSFGQCATMFVGFGAGESGETGSPNFGQSAVPQIGVSFTQVSGGIYHSAGLLADGTVVCWGDNVYAGGSGRVLGSDASGQPIVSGSVGQRVQVLGVILSGIVEVRAGELHTVARRADGSVVVWGNNSYGQLSVPSGLVAARIDAGSLHTLALRVDGSVACWGGNYCGSGSHPTESGFAGIAAGYEHSLAWRTDGRLHGWGRNDRGQSAVPSSLPSFVQADAGVLHSIVLGGDGIVRAWGDNTGGQCGGTNADGSADVSGGQHLRVVRILGQTLGDVVAVSAGGYHSLALRADGSVVAWGAASTEPTWPHGQTGVPTTVQGRSVLVDGGYVHSLVEVVTDASDCDSNGRLDCVEIILGQASDSNSNGAIDPCEVDGCPGDVNESGVVNAVDLAAVLGAWGTDGGKFPRADTNDDGIVDAFDLAQVLSDWGACP